MSDGPAWRVRDCLRACSCRRACRLPGRKFADPFVSFKGLARFKENLDNLAGGFITDSECRYASNRYEPRLPGPRAEQQRAAPPVAA